MQADLVNYWRDVESSVYVNTEELKTLFNSEFLNDRSQELQLQELSAAEKAAFIHMKLLSKDLLNSLRKSRLNKARFYLDYGEKILQQHEKNAFLYSRLQMAYIPVRAYHEYRRGDYLIAAESMQYVIGLTEQVIRQAAADLAWIFKLQLYGFVTNKARTMIRAGLVAEAADLLESILILLRKEIESSHDKNMRQLQNLVGADAWKVMKKNNMV